MESFLWPRIKVGEGSDGLPWEGEKPRWLPGGEERRGGTFGKGEGKQGARNYDLSLINTLHKELHLKELLTDSFFN